MKGNFLFRKKAQKTVLALALSLVTIAGSGMATFAAPQAIQESDELYHGISFEEELAEAEQVLSLGDTSNQTTNLVLAHSYGLHVNIAWASSDEAVVDLQGKVILPADEDKDVTLTATLSSTKTENTKTKTFTIHVPKASATDILERDAKDAMEYVDYIVNTGYKLPDSAELGIRSQIVWKLTAGEAQLKDNVITKTDKSAERQHIELKGILTYEGETKEISLANMTLLDEYAGYILSYFAGKEESKEMYIGYSYDGIHWMRLNNADAVLTPTLGDEQIRDPFIMRKKDGSFAIFCTDGWNGNELTIWDSEYLTSFNNERLCIMREGKKAINPDGPSGFHTWAPECNYDPITDQYIIYWSDPKGNNQHGQTYYNTSTDLLTFSEPGILFGLKTPMIDASIKKYKGDFYMVYNDSTGDNSEESTGRRIYMAKADSLEAGAFYPYEGALSEQVAEGPFLFQNFETGSWMAYYDFYQLHKFGVTTIDDITTDKWEYWGINETMPWDEVRHGGVIPVTQKELDKIFEKWKTEEPEIIEITETESITAYVGDNADDLKLPENVTVILADGSSVQIPVNWDTSGISTESTGTCTISGTLSESDYAEKGDLKTALTIEIVERPASGNTAIIIAIIGAVVIAGGAVTLLIIKKKKSINNL